MHLGPVYGVGTLTCSDVMHLDWSRSDGRQSTGIPQKLTTSFKHPTLGFDAQACKSTAFSMNLTNIPVLSGGIGGDLLADLVTGYLWIVTIDLHALLA